MKKKPCVLFVCLLTVLFLFLSSESFVWSQSPADPGNTFRVLDIGERTYENGPAIAVVLSQPLDPAVRHDEHLRISDSQEMLKSAWVLSDDQRVLYYPHVEPETFYSVTVMDTLRSASGQTIEKRAYKALTTRKITPAISFASDGLLLPEKLTEGLPVVSVNVKSVQIEFFRVNEAGLQHFVRWRKTASRHETWELNESKKYYDLVYSGRFELEAPPNKRVINHIPVMTIKALRDPGVYFAVMREFGKYEHDYQTTYFFVSDIGLHARVYPNETLVLASSLKTGLPLSGVKVDFLNDKAKSVWRGLTDENGRCRYPLNISRDKVSFIKAVNDDHITIVSFDLPALDLSEFELNSRPQRPREIFVYSPRDLYRPGEAVVVSALLRDYDGRPIKDLPFKARLYRPDGRRVRSFTWHAEASERSGPGYYQTELVLPGNAQTGRWRLDIFDDPSSKYPARVFGFQVEDFMPERMKLELDSAQEILKTIGNWKIDVTGAYLYGAPASGNKLSAKVRVKAQRTLFENLKGYQFGDANSANYSDYWELEDMKLDDQGRLGVTVKNKWWEVKSPLSVRYLASLFETGGRPINRSIDHDVWPANKLVGIRPLFQGNTVEEGAVNFEVIKVGTDGALLPAKGLLVTLTKEDRDYYWEYSDSRGWQQKYTENAYEILSDTLDLDGTKAALYKLQLRSGRYLLGIRNPETNLITSVRFHVGYWWYEGDEGAGARPDKVQLELDKPNYLPGDVIKLTVTPPHSGDAVIIVEGETPLWFKRAEVSSKGTVVEIPFSAAWDSHNIYISAVVFRPGSAQEKITPNRAVGLVHLPLDREDRKLGLEIEAPEKVSPQGPTNMTVNLKLQEKPSKETFVTVAAVDVGILNITDFKTPDPLAWFFTPRRFAVDAYDIYGKVIEIMDGRLARLSCGGDADISKGGRRPETKLKLVSLFEGPVAFNELGEAQVTLTVPGDFNGRVRLMAVAYNQNQFGSAEDEVTVAAPVVTQLSMPRVLAPGDASEFTLDVHNMSGRDQELSLILEASAPLIIENGEKVVPVKDQEKVVLRFPVKAGEGFGVSDIRLRVTGEGIDLGGEWQLGIRPGYPGVARKVRQVLKPGESFTLDPALAADLMAGSVEADLKISPVLPLNLKEAMRSLITYPYGCLEQTTSRAYPLLYATPDNIQRFGLPFINHDERLKRLNQAIERISLMQLSKGGFGLWSERSPEEPWLTVYAADFLLQARDRGLDVPEDMLDRALNRLHYYIQKKWPSSDELGEDIGLDFAIRSYAAFVLAKVKRAPLGSLRTMYDNHIDEAASNLPLVHLGLALKAMGDNTRSDEAIKKAVLERRPQYTFWGDYGTDVRDLALSLALLIENDPNMNEIGPLMLDLEEMLRHRKWFSTQEKYALFKTGLAMEPLTQKEWSGVVVTAGRETFLKRNKPYVMSPDVDEIAGGVTFQSDSKGLLYVSAVVSGYTKTPPEKDDSLIVLERQLYDLDGKPVKTNDFHVGELLLVHMTVNSRKAMPDALIVDLVPAGFEIENPNLKYSIKLDDTDLENLKIGGRDVWRLKRKTKIVHSEYLSDRYVAVADLDRNRTDHLFYLVRVVSPGTFILPPTMAESMYRPEYRGVGDTPGYIRVINKSE